MRYFISKTIKGNDCYYNILDLDRNKVTMCTKEVLMQKLVQDSTFVVNLGIRDNKLIATQGRMDKYVVVGRTIGLILLHKSGNMYVVADSLGKVHTMSEDMLIREARVHTLSNAKIVVNSRKSGDTVKIEPLGFTLQNLQQRVPTLDIGQEGFEVLRKLYSSISTDVHGRSGRGEGGNLVNYQAFCTEQKYIDSDISYFIQCYKLVRAKIIRDTSYTYQRVYSKYTYMNGKVKIEDIIGYHVMWKDSTEVFILKEDKHLVSLLQTSKCIEPSYKNLKNLFVYDRDYALLTDSIPTTLQVVDGYNKEEWETLSKIRKTGEMLSFSVTPNYRFHTNVGVSLTMKYKLLLTSQDNKVLKTN